MIAGAATSALGLPLGGVLVDAWGWRTTFLINLPFALLALAMAFFWIPSDLPVEGPRTLREVAARLDMAGIVGFGGAMAALLVFLMGLPHPDWIALGMAVVAGTGLVWWELRASRPFFDVRLLGTNPALTRTYLRFALAGLCVYTVLYGLTQWLQAGRGMSSEKAGLLLLPMSALSALLVRPISQRNLVRMPLVVAAVTCLAASAGVCALTTGTPIAWIVVITLLFGVTLGTTISANQTALYTQVTGRPDRYRRGTVPNFRLPRFDRLVRADLRRVPHSGQRSPPACDCPDHGRRQCPGADHRGHGPQDHDSGSDAPR